MRRAELVAVLATALTGLAGAGVAEPGGAAPGGAEVVHRVSRGGESYADLAARHYGDPALERILRPFNRLSEPLAAGTRVRIPTWSRAALGDGETLEGFAGRRLGAATRAAYLDALHDLGGLPPRPGQLLRVPTSVLHVVRPGESLRDIARTFYGEGGPRRMRLLALYNELGGRDVRPGMRVFVPLDHDVLDVDRVRARLKAAGAAGVPRAATARPPTPPSTGAEVARPEAPGPARALEAVAALWEEGRYGECARQATAALDADPPLEVRAELLVLQASSLVALDRLDDARRAFALLRRMDRTYSLDPVHTSPRILEVFESLPEPR